VTSTLPALAVALLLPAALAPGRARAEELYVIEQLVAGLNNAPDATGERIASVKSGDKLEVIERSGDQVHVRTANGREGWIRASYLTADEPLRARLAERTAEVARLKEDVSRLAAQLEAARAGASSGPKAPAPQSAASTPAEPAEEAVRSPRRGLFGNGPDEGGRRVWPWALGSALLALIVGFALGALVLDRHIRRKYGGLRIY
jgi:Bacterial SH3 domain